MVNRKSVLRIGIIPFLMINNDLTKMADIRFSFNRTVVLNAALALMFVLSKPKLSVYLSINIIQIRQSWKKQLQN